MPSVTRSFMLPIVRTLIILMFLSGASALIYWKLADDAKQRTIDELSTMNAELEQRIAAREEMIDRLEATRRVGHLRVIDQTLDDHGSVADTTIEWIELDSDGKALATQTVRVPGETIYFDAWTIKFPQGDVAEGHPMRGRTLLLLRRIYSERLTPSEGVEIDTPGGVPAAYAVSEMGQWQQRLWESFWEIATNAKLAREMGVRVAQGEAVYKPVRKDQVYELVLDAVGGMSMVPIESTEGVRAASADQAHGHD